MMQEKRWRGRGRRKNEERRGERKEVEKEMEGKRKITEREQTFCPAILPIRRALG